MEDTYMDWSNLIWIALVVLMVIMMVRGGGCCGRGAHKHARKEEESHPGEPQHKLP